MKILIFLLLILSFQNFSQAKCFKSMNSKDLRTETKKIANTLNLIKLKKPLDGRGLSTAMVTFYWATFSDMMFCEDLLEQAFKKVTKKKERKLISSSLKTIISQSDALHFLKSFSNILTLLSIGIVVPEIGEEAMRNVYRITATLSFNKGEDPCPYMQGVFNQWSHAGPAAQLSFMGYLTHPTIKLCQNQYLWTDVLREGYESGDDTIFWLD